MPRIPTITAQGDARVLNLPRPQPAQFGGPGFRALEGAATQFGQTMLIIERHAQAQKDELDVLDLAGRFDERLPAIQEEVLRQPDLDATQRATLTQTLTNRLRDDLQKETQSPAVRHALQRHALRQLPTLVVATQAEGLKRDIDHSLARLDRLEERYSLKAAEAPSPDLAEATLMEYEEELDRARSRRILSAQHYEQRIQGFRHRYWETVIQRDPDRMISIFASGEIPDGTVLGVPKMDRQRVQHYMNLAMGTITAQQFRQERALKAEEAAIKQVQDANARQLTADVLERKPQALANMPALLRNRFITDDTARTLNALERTLAKEPRTDKLVSGLAANLETSLRRMKYSPEPLPDGSDQVLLSAFLNDQITKEEFTHLMSVYAGVQDYKAQVGKEEERRQTSRVRTLLQDELETTGPADKFDALTNQTIVKALEFFDARIDQEPGNAAAIKEEAIRLFKPVIQNRLNLSKTDEVKLDDARMQALRRTGAISAAGLKAWQDRREEQKGWQIVEETLRNLPPVQEPGFFERLNPFGSKTTPAPSPPAPEAGRSTVKPRKKAGVFGE